MKSISTSLLAIAATAAATITSSKGALLVIDVQTCFTASGTLPVGDAEPIIPIINKMRDDYEGKLWDHVFFSQDWHCEEHISFASTNEKTVTDLKELNYTSGGKLCKDGVIDNKILPADTLADCAADENVTTVTQYMWPDHCIKDSDDARMHPELVIKTGDVIQTKGENCYVDSYSAFLSNAGLVSTGLEQKMKALNITHVYVAGLASDFCVKFSSIDAASLGFTSFMIQDASRGIAPNLTSAYADMEAGNVSVITTTDLAALVPVPATTTTVTGYVVDNFCWGKPNHKGIDGSELGTAPGTHILHCLTWTPCKPDGYIVLAHDSAPVPTYEPLYQLDDMGDKLVIEMVGKELMRGGDGQFDEEWTITGTLPTGGSELTVTRVCLTPSTGRNNAANETFCVGEKDMPESPPDTNCTGTWSACTVACEPGHGRMLAMTAAQSGSGQECPAAEDCTVGMGACVEAIPTKCGDATPIACTVAPNNVTKDAATVGRTVALCCGPDASDNSKSGSLSLLPSALIVVATGFLAF